VGQAGRGRQSTPRLAPAADRGTNLSPANVAELQSRLAELEQMLEAIRAGQVDSVVVGHGSEARVYALETADRPYRVLFEEMHEGASTVSHEGVVLYCNRRFSELAGRDPSSVVGQRFDGLIPPDERKQLKRLFQEALRGHAQGELQMIGPDGRIVPLNLPMTRLP
jgi:PAS domain S-box-containing protein